MRTMRSCRREKQARKACEIIALGASAGHGQRQVGVGGPVLAILHPKKREIVLVGRRSRAVPGPTWPRCAEIVNTLTASKII